MPTCSKCAMSIRPGRGVASKMRQGKRITYHLICPRRPKRKRERKYQGAKPSYTGWTGARLEAITGRCEVSGTILVIYRKDGTTKRAPYAIDHILPARIVESTGKDPHARVNLICLSGSEHSKKRAAEDALLKRGDLLTYLQELTRLHWPMKRVHAALKFYGIRHSHGICVFCDTMEAGLQPKEEQYTQESVPCQQQEPPS